MFLLLIKCLCLLLAIIYGTSILVKGGMLIAGRKAFVPGFHIFLMALGIVGFLLLHVWLGV